MITRPERLRLELTDNYNGVYTEVIEWHAGILKSTFPSAIRDGRAVTPGDDAWERFWTLCETCGVWRWRPSYCEPDMTDGSGWSLDLSDGERHITAEGINKTPQQFERFVKGLRTMMEDPGPQ